MLTDLTIRDLVLIERLDLTFDGGLSVLTGETGAGKSILLDAVSLVLGARADPGMVRKGAKKLSVIASFQLPPHHPVWPLLQETDLDPEPDEPLILRREVGAEGGSKAWINDRPASAGLLRRLGAELVEIHGQFESHGLLDASNHVPVLDSFGRDTPKALDAARTAYRSWRTARQNRIEAEQAIARARDDEANLRAALEELEALAPEVGEEASLAAERALLMNGEKLAETLGAALTYLSEPVEAAHLLSLAARQLDRVRFMAEADIAPILDGLERAGVELAEARNSLEHLTARLEADPKRLESVEGRLFALRGLARKHGCSADDLPSRLEAFAAALTSLDDGEYQVDHLRKAETSAREAYLVAAQGLSKARKKAAIDLDRAINAELPPVKLDKARFETSISKLPEDQWGERGFDKVVFLIATNPGADPAPIQKIASGGELARFMLALKVVLSGSGSVGTLVFDEVDTGIGGATAAAVGERLKALGQRLQVLVVTHSPQVAAMGSHHYRVSKTARGDGLPGTEVSSLDEPTRLEEIARMLSGATITTEARAAAAVLLGKAL